MSLERDLREIGARLDYPPTPDLAGRVEVRLAAGPELRRRPLLLRRVALAGAAAVAAIAVVLAVPPAREAVADLLGIGRVQIEVVDTLPPVGTLPVGSGLALGEEVSLDEARALSTFPVRVPGELGDPDTTYLAPNGDLFFAYAPRQGLPEVLDSGVGALFGQFPELGTPIVKQAGPDTGIELAAVDGEPAFWIEGGPHVVFFESPGAPTRQLDGRLAGNVLIWQDGDVTYRLEVAVDQAAAIEIAESLG